ncbi:hypothetical protein AAFX60_006985 [Aliivibrio fischeri]
MTATISNKQFKRSGRPLAALNRAYWDGMVKTPSKFEVLQAPCGQATRRSLVKDVAAFMDTLVSNMCFVSRKVGRKPSANGTFLYTWEAIADLMKVPTYRVKQCFEYASDRGWVESSDQARERGEDGKFIFRVTTKKVTMKYFTDLGLIEKFKEAQEAAKAYLTNKAKGLGVTTQLMLTPVGILNAIRKRNAEKGSYTPDYVDKGEDIPY